jgi:hypothetical protein
MLLKEILEKSKESKIFQEIEQIFKTELKKVSSEHEIKVKQEGNWITLMFWLTDKNYSDQSLNLTVKDGTLELSDVYIPATLRNKGFLTTVLTKIRKVTGLNGKLKIHVGMNQEGWKKIVKSSGFEWVNGETDAAE